MLDAGRILKVIDSQIDKKIRSGAGLDITYGQVFGIEGDIASVYLHGSRELVEEGEVAEPSAGFRIPTHLYVNPSDYVRVTIDQRGHRWIDEVFAIQPSGGTTSGGTGSLVWKPVMANSPNIITTDGSSVFVPLVTTEGEAIMALVAG